MQLTRLLEGVLHKPKPPKDEASPHRWRDNAFYFRPEEECVEMPRGIATFSPGWLEQGRVGIQLIFLVFSSKDNLQHFFDKVCVSADLGGNGKSRSAESAENAQLWVRSMAETAALLSAALVIVNPSLYELNRESLIRLSYIPELEARIKEWGFAFNAVSVISNRASPVHRDNKSGGWEYPDVICSVGGGPRTVLEMPGLGVRCLYSPGSVAIFSGNLHLHSVSDSEHERLCIACYTRQPVHAHVNLGTPGFPKVADVLPKGWWPTLR
jgi:hypothetical protein